jgi:hypothetical protein
MPPRVILKKIPKYLTLVKKDERVRRPSQRSNVLLKVIHIYNYLLNLHVCLIMLRTAVTFLIKFWFAGHCGSIKIFGHYR